jgi:glutathione synthase/RimK-type ligase-like ATP-grasp enzyme
MFRLLILANEQPNDHNLWIKACENQLSVVSYRVVDLTKDSWLEQIKKEPADYLLAKPGGVTDSFKKLYDERLQILVNELGYKVYPSLNEVLIYENKRYLSFWLSANGIAHPETNVFYFKKEALNFVKSSKFPFVAKLNIGASGNGVSIIKTINQAENYINKVFTKGLTARTGPRLDREGLLKRALFMISHPGVLGSRLSLYKSVFNNPQRDFCIFQEYIQHSFEWRVVRIGDSFFAHKKVIKNDKASGSLIKEYVNPPVSLLDFVMDITEKHSFRSLAIDIFETGKDTYLVNEMQCIFGQSDPYQMLVDGKPGRYVKITGNWIFEEGAFNTNESYDLRVNEVISQLKRVNK